VNELSQHLPFQQFHGEEQQVPAAAHPVRKQIVDAADMRMGDLTQTHFPEAFHHLLVHGACFVKCFYGNPIAKQGIERFADFSHPASSQQTNHPEALRENIAVPAHPAGISASAAGGATAHRRQPPGTARRIRVPSVDGSLPGAGLPIPYTAI
jgi:hypothetical protein